MQQAAELNHLVWIKEKTWRVLACYATEEEARAVAARIKAQGDKARYALRGSPADLALRANVWRQ